MKDQIFRDIIRDFYDVPIMNNLARPHFVERMIARTPAPDWKLVSEAVQRRHSPLDQ